MPGVRVCATGTVALMASLAVPVAEVAGSVVRHAMRHDFLPGFPPGQVLGHVGRADLAWIQVALVADRVQDVFDCWTGSNVAVQYWNGRASLSWFDNGGAEFDDHDGDQFEKLHPPF